jgi:hypothetical protein
LSNGNKELAQCGYCFEMQPFEIAFNSSSAWRQTGSGRVGSDFFSIGTRGLVQVEPRKMDPLTNIMHIAALLHTGAVAQGNVVWAMDACNKRGRFSGTAT